MKRTPWSQRDKDSKERERERAAKQNSKILKEERKKRATGELVSFG